MKPSFLHVALILLTRTTLSLRTLGSALQMLFLAETRLEGAS